ncbi:hypothetical protein [Senegalia massiliensis]|uniref:Uncharacterized protein n=1 Tax=Senegalia massiliensis TaxID=1720316 RepID=A0A845R3S9_9CLOT|nr:hypothetical protein [Senegalia massiliensis]NBI08092.1 hypothetical protein [Senegalia massiliensis]
MKLPYGSYSKKGFRGSGMRLHHSEYFKYIYQGKEYFYKKKFYVSAYDGDIKYEKITDTTFKKAVTRGNITEELIVIEDFEEISFQVLSEIISEAHNIGIKYSKEAVENTLDTIEELEKITDKLDKHFKRILFKSRVNNFVDYIIPVKRMKEAI